ncbi:MAG: relaxase domain-containing protein [Gloeocapsa sp. UFS-A4-WI-NPMV-4B04]|nr:relaxase domain-containing protein [Gloeocapsa sp. UFS-A4-WI-NPMV-4B04]
MLTLANFNTTQAKTYYKRENYYSQEEAQANSEWRGQGASQYHLSGSISDLDAYEKIVDGLSPDGKTQLRQKQNHKGKKERAGVDLTFSAPKSVSLACLVGGDSRLEEAHRIAVRRTIDLIEERYAFTRINDERVKTGNLIVAVWHHDTSRELDPHLHSHCLLMNCTQSPDGKWRTLSNEEFFRNKILLGQIYRNELALECRKLGYEIEPHPKELFEIKGYTREQIEAFSKRHEQIKEKLAEIGLAETTENKIWAWRKTRVKKNHEIDRKEMLPYWHEEADLYGITHPLTDLAPQVIVAPPALEEVEAELVAAVQAGIEHCSERKVAFKSEDIEKFVTTETRPFGINKVQEAIAQHPELIKTFDGRYTTQAALTRELATIDLMQQGKGILNPITHPETIDRYLENKTLTQGQREAVTVAATTKDQFIAWQGVAGAGKTYALNQLKQVTTALSDVAPDYVIKGFAPSAAAAKVLEDELGIEANTVARLLVSKQSEQVHPNQIWIVDEAGLLSAKAAHELLERATQERARVILVGDTRQLSAIEAGNPFKSLQQAGIQTAHLNESLRQKAPDLQKAVNLAAAGQMMEAIAHLEQVGRIAEIADIELRTKKIATEYIKLLPQERQETLILAGTHKEQKAIVNEIRAELKREGTLGYGVEATTLKALNLTSVQARYTHNYSVGDVVVPIREYRRSGLHKSQPYTVKARSQDKLILSDEAGNHLTVDPMKFRKTVYKQETNEIATGDRLRWARNDKELGRRNGQEFTVTGIEGQTAFIQYCDGKSARIDLSQPLHCDYALVSTTYSSQGKTADRVLISSTVDRTVSQESLYVAVSRAKHDLQIFAEDRSFLFEQAEESNAQETVLELLQYQSKQQTPQQPAPDVNQAVEPSSVATPVKPKAKRDFLSTIPSVEIRSSKPVASPVKRSDQNPNEVKLPNLTVRFSAPHRPIQKPVEPFWIPGSASDAPTHIEEKHWRELVEGSAIHPEIASRNFRSLEQDPIEKHHEAWEYLMYSDKLERTNTGRLSSGMLNKYTHIEAGGWWCGAGVDSRSFIDLQPGQKPSEQIWGCYKPNEPRENIDKPGKIIKYEHPPKTDLGIFLLDVPNDIADRIYDKTGVNPSNSDRASGFWYCVWKHNLPITITEGAKKAASLLSQGHAAIGLPGIYAGYRSKDEIGNPIKARLHEKLAVFATPEREIRFCFDFETRPETKRNIEIAISRTGSLLKQKHCQVNVVSLPGPEKGVDDLIAAIGPLAYEQQHAKALPLQEWRTRNKQQQAAIEPPKVLSVESRKLRIKAKLTLGQPVNNHDFNQAEEPTHDCNHQQLKAERTTDGRETNSESDCTIDQKDGTVRNHEYRIEQYSRAVEGKQRSTGREDYLSRSQPDRESERSESELHRLLEAISGYLELEEVGQQLGAFIAETSRSLTGEHLRGKREQGIARPVEGQSSASIDRAASNGSIERQDADPEQRRATRQLLIAITSYLDAAALAESPIANKLRILTENLKQHQNVDVAMRKLETAITDYRSPETSLQALAAFAKLINESCSESALSTTLESVIGQLSSDRECSLSSQSATKNSSKEQPSIEQSTSDQAINAISSYLEQQEVLDSTIAQNLTTFSEQLRPPSVAARNQQLTSVKTEHLKSTDYQQTTQRVISSIAQYVETQTIEATPLEQNLEALSDQLLQSSSQEVAETRQQSSVSPIKGQPKVAKTKAIEIQTSQLLKALADYVEVTGVEVALVQSLETLIEELHQRSYQGVNKGQKNAPCSKAIAEYIEQEVVEAEILPILENVVVELNTLQKSESLPLISVNPNPDISKRAYDSIASFIEQAAVESGITESLENLAKELRQIKPQIPTSIKQLDSTVSNLLQQLEAVKARKQQETSARAVKAIVNYIDHEAVESVLNPQVLQTLINQFEQFGKPKLTAAMRQLEAIAADYQTRLQTQAVKPIVKAIGDYCEHTAINEAIALDIERLAQNLSLPSKSKLPKQLQQLGSTIEQLCQQIEAQQNVTVQKPITESNAEQEPLANQKAQALEQQRLVYRQKYQELQKRVRSYPGFSDSPNWEVDIGVTLLVGKESSDPDEVGRVLTQSDQLREWKASLPEDEYMAEGKAYIHQVYEQAQQLREARSLQQQKWDLDLEI